MIVAGGGDQAAGRRRDLTDRALMTGGARRHFLADSPVPDTDADSADGCQPAAIGREDDVGGLHAVRRQLAHELPRPAIQQQDAATRVVASPVAPIANGDCLAIAGEGQPGGADIIAELDLMFQVACRHVPLADERLDRPQASRTFASGEKAR